MKTKPSAKPQLSLEATEALLSLNLLLLQFCESYEATGTASISAADEEAMRKGYAALGGEEYYRDEILPALAAMRKGTGK